MRAEGVRTWLGEVILVEGVVWKERKRLGRSHEPRIRCVPKRSAWSGRWCVESAEKRCTREFDQVVRVL